MSPFEEFSTLLCTLNSSSNDSAVMIAKLELKKMDEKKKLRSEKQRLKDLETPEEKRARRLRKKQVLQAEPLLLTAHSAQCSLGKLEVD